MEQDVYCPYVYLCQKQPPVVIVADRCHHKLLNTLVGWEVVLRWARWPVMPVEGTVVGYSWCLCEPVSNTGRPTAQTPDQVTPFPA